MSAADTSSWVGAITGIIAAVIGVITLLTVYVAAAQLYSRRQIYQLGLSRECLGPWRSIVMARPWHKLWTDVKTPTITVSNLLKEGWEPVIGLVQSGMEAENSKAAFKLQRSTSFDLFLEFQRLSNALNIKKTGRATRNRPEETIDLLADERKHVEASWVNLLSSLGIRPIEEHKRFYKLQSEQELVNGMVPMRWKGRDLVAVASILGFQTCTDEKVVRDGRAPMPLPSLWYGALGWLQFRASSEGCIAEFRAREISTRSLVFEHGDTHAYYTKFYQAQAKSILPRYALQRRLWQSIGGFVLAEVSGPENSICTLYLGGRDCSKTRGRDNAPRRTEELCAEAIAQPDGVTDDDMCRLVYGEHRTEWPDEFQQQNPGLSQLLPSDRHDIPRSKKGSNTKRNLEVLVKCPGLLHTVAEGTWAETRGLDWRNNIYEYHRIFMKPEELRSSKYAQTHIYEMGDLCMDRELLGRLKSGLRLLKPDLFYFCPSPIYSFDLTEIFQHVRGSLKGIDLHYIFPQEAIRKLKAENDPALYHALLIVNEIQRLNHIGREHLAIQDIQLITIASAALSKLLESRALCSIGSKSNGSEAQEGAEADTAGTSGSRSSTTSVPQNAQTSGTFVNTTGTDLEWAFVYSPCLFEDMLRRLEHMDVSLLKIITDEKIVLRNPPADPNLNPEESAGNTCKRAYPKNGSVEIDCSKITRPATSRKIPWPSRLTGKYTVPLGAEYIDLKRGEEKEIDGLTVLAAFVNVLLVYFWQSKRWVTNVAVFDISIPQSVTMV